VYDVAGFVLLSADLALDRLGTEVCIRWSVYVLGLESGPDM
jgi:hypothetical protein